MNAQEEEYVTLFCEGDGHVRITPGGYPRVTFDNKERDVIDCIASLIGDRQPSQDKRGYWHLVFGGSSCLLLLEMFSRCVVGRQFLDRLNKVLEYVGMPLTVQHPLTLDGFIGFWDAEGSSDSQPTIFVSQKDREVLDLVVKLLGGGVSCVEDSSMHQWHLSGEKARALYSVLLEKSHNLPRIESLRDNFEGLKYFEHKDKVRAYNKVYNDTHKEEMRTRDKTHWQGRKAVQEWMKTHPEEVVRFQESS